MPSRWSAVVLLQPFSPPQDGNQQPDSPFYQLCLANLSYVEGEYFSAQIAGSEYGTWWYTISTQLGTQLSTDQGMSWTTVNMGWQLPVNGWFGNTPPTCAGTSPLNWMQAQTAEWWKIPVALSSGPPAATWMWFDVQNRNPVRMMYGQGPTSPTQGDPSQLPLLQMYSFTYFSYFIDYADDILLPSAPWQQPTIAGLELGNPQGYSNFVFNSNFGMTALMTPVNEEYNPLPTRVLYVWKPDDEYAVATDRAQSTLMLNTYNPGLPPQAPMASQQALLTGRAPAGMQPPAGSDTSFLITNNTDCTQSCAGPPSFNFPQEAPDWVSIPGVQATIRATITNNPVLCPNTTILIYSVLFPPSTPNYPESTYLWTWYAPLTMDGTLSRPVTFMQSQSGVGVGTSLALADYFAFELFPEPIDPANFAVPSVCTLPTSRQGAPSSPIAVV
jgi:hypothetical protein